MSTAPCTQEGEFQALSLVISKGTVRSASRPAAFWRRGVAWCLDSVVQVLLWALSSITGLAIGLVGALMNASAETSQLVAGFSTVVLMVIGSWLYSAYMESSEHQATYGKMLAGILVTDLDGHRISFGRASARHFAKYLSAFALMFGYLVALFSHRKQAMHDMAAETVVVRASA